MESKSDKVNYEDALNATGWGKFNYLMFTMYSSVIAAMMFETYSVSYLVPASACELKTTSEQQGLIAALPLLGVIATSFLWGYLADKKGRRYILCFSMFLGYFTGSLASLSTNWILLCIFKTLSSAAVAGGLAIAITLVSECTPAKQRGTVLTMMVFVSMLCVGIMAVMSMPVLPLKFSYFIPGLNIYFNSWRALNLVYSFPCAIAAVFAACSCESPKYLLNVQDEIKTMNLLRMMFAMNTGKSKDEYKINSVVLGETIGTSKGKGFFGSIVSQTIPMFKFPLLKDTLLLATLFFIVFLCANPVLVWLPVILNAFMSSVENGAAGLSICQMINLAQNSTVSIEEVEVESCSLGNKAMSVVLMMCTGVALICLVVSYLLNYFGKHCVRFFLCIQISCAVAGLCINFSPFWILSAVLFLIMMAEMINYGLLVSFTVNIFPTYLKATAVSLLLMIARASAIIGITGLKRLLDINCELAFYAFGVLSMFAALLGFRLKVHRPSISQNGTP